MTVQSDQNGAEFVAAVDVLRSAHKIHVNIGGGGRIMNGMNGGAFPSFFAGSASSPNYTGFVTGARGVDQCCAGTAGTKHRKHSLTVRKVCMEHKSIVGRREGGNISQWMIHKYCNFAGNWMRREFSPPPGNSLEPAAFGL
jgi:hypothetical protein